ncbi:quinon protein alcohol dehydrogenase-like superfamily [Vararia minispora EC-137]|uniref:Quinon protein alcohol dehydrogenase-like superfamily n=1 Tax=Vararia minispora EC-137 TaxID=1314806 RepID=A0ACB8QRE9_9AGAM|nr:quinon protein alcohol dehydrogenase-like superfamily [Vararia minispora EC-137]
MDFTELYKHSNGLVSFSQGAHFILTAVHDRLIVRRADTFQVSRSWQVDLTPSPSRVATSTGSRRPSEPMSITHIGWSSDSEYVLAACAKLGVAHVFCMRDEQWHASIEAGAEGLVKAEWAPDGRHVLCFSEWGLRVTVWSLLTGNATYIQYPVHPDRGYAFRRDGRYFVLAERHKSKDTIGVYDAADSYKLVRHYPLPTTSMASIAISPSGNHVAVWEGPLEYKLCILSLTGELIGSFKPDPDPGLGIRCVAWHPSGMFIALAGWDDRIHILEHLTWSKVATLNASTRVPESVNFWREPSNWLEATEGRGFLSYERLNGTHSVPSTRPDPSKPHPKSGAVQLEFNKLGTTLMARFENMSTAIHLFSFPAPGEAFTPHLRSVLVHSRPVLHTRWNPLRAGSLVATCGASAVYTWSDEWVGEGGEAEEMAECIGVPAKNFEARDVRWAPDGKGMVLLDKETFCCAFEVEESSM